MISLDEQNNLLLAIAGKLKKPITCYAIGGTAMMLLGLKDSTLDIDLVFENNSDLLDFSSAAVSLGYKKMDSIIVYGAKKNRPEMLALKDSRFDLFLEKVVHFTFSQSMKKRASAVRQYGEKLIIKVADYHDIILMKCATDRLKDKDDISAIISSKLIKWDILIEEAKVQINLGVEAAALELGDTLSNLKKTLKDKIPVSVVETLLSMVEKQVEEKRKAIKG